MKKEIFVDYGLNSNPVNNIFPCIICGKSMKHKPVKKGEAPLKMTVACYENLDKECNECFAKRRGQV